MACKIPGLDHKTFAVSPSTVPRQADGDPDVLGGLSRATLRVAGESEPSPTTSDARVSPSHPSGVPHAKPTWLFTCKTTYTHHIHT